MNHTEINYYLKKLQNAYEKHVKVIEVGKSFEGRVLKAIKITNGDGIRNKSVIFVHGGMFAREWVSTSTALHIIRQLVENFEKNKSLLKRYDWVIMPLVNPDGYEFSRSDTFNRMWTKTRQPYGECAGVNLNLNFGHMYGVTGGSDDPCSEYYFGPHPYSEPETAALQDLLLRYKQHMVFYLSLESFGDYILYPWGFDEIDAANAVNLHEVALAGVNAIQVYSGRKYFAGSAAKRIYPSAGSSMDFAYHNNPKIAITMMLPGGGKSGYDPEPKTIKPIVRESWIGIIAMVKKVTYLCDEGQMSCNGKH